MSTSALVSIVEELSVLRLQVSLDHGFQVLENRKQKTGKQKILICFAWLPPIYDKEDMKKTTQYFKYSEHHISH